MSDHIFKRLDELGIEEVRHLQKTCGLPDNWNHYIRDWLKRKSEEKKKDEPK